MMCERRSESSKTARATRSILLITINRANAPTAVSHGLAAAVDLSHQRILQSADQR